MPNVDNLYVKRYGTWRQPSSMLMNDPDLEYARQIWVKHGGVWTVVWEKVDVSSTHNSLGGRDAADAHPILAITGLVDALAGKLGILDTAVNSDKVDGYHVQVDGTGTDPNTIYLKTTGGEITVDWSDVTGTPTTLSGYGITDALSSSLKGAPNGLAELDGSGKVPASQLPSYVDEVQEYANFASLPVSGITDIIYITTDTNKIYRWTGSTYVEISPTAGNADTATKLATARNIAMTGDVAWNVNFDGSSNVSSTGTLANTGVSAGTYNNSATAMTPFTVDAKGRVTSTGTPVTMNPLNSDKVDGYHIQVDGTGTDPNTIYLKTTGGSITVAWTDVTGKPTTVQGYGITNAVRTDASTTMDIGVTHTTKVNSNNPIATLPNGVTCWEARGNGTGPAVMTFHRPGVYAAFFGLDTDNKWKVGGWSMGANSYEILHEASYTNYTVTKTGSGASGTWGINITGNANYSNSAGSASKLGNTGYDNAVFSWRQSDTAFAGYTGGWASYLISNHGDGATYYNQTIIMPFSGAPQYSRLVAGTLSGPHTFITTENQSSYAPTLTGTGASGTWPIAITGNANTVDGYHIQVDGTGSDPNTIYLKTTGGSITVSWTDVTGKPTTLEGYGITGGTLTGNLTVNGNAYVVGTILAKYGAGGEAVRIGDDASFYDVNLANTIGIKGVSNSALGFIKLGDASEIGWNGSAIVNPNTTIQNGVLYCYGQAYSSLNSAGLVAPYVAQNSNTGANTNKGIAGIYAKGFDTGGSPKTAGYVAYYPLDNNWVGSQMRFVVRSGDTEVQKLQIGGDGTHYCWGNMTFIPDDSGRVRSDKARSNVGWNYAHFEAYTPTGSTVDFASFTCHIQDQSTAVQFGVYNNGSVTKSGVFNSNGSDLLIYNHSTGTAFANGVELGFRHVPVTVSNAATTLAQTHNGKAIGKDNTSAYTYSIPDGLDIGTIITVFNNAASGNITVAMSGSEVMRLAGTTSTGSRTVGPYGEGTFHKVSATTWLGAGPAVT